MTSEDMAALLAEEVRTYVDEAVSKLLADIEVRFKSITIPTPEPGAPGKDGTNGVNGERGMDGKDGRDGRDGIAKDGKDGRDGILLVTEEVSKMVQAEVEKRLAVEVTKNVDAAIGALPLMLYKGVWQEGTAYREGNTVTWAGSGWVCMKSDTTSKPGIDATWVLAIKKGRDAK